MNKNKTYSTPEGYFETLNERLYELPARNARTPFALAVRPYLAMAACLALALILGKFLLTGTAASTESDDELAEYLIESGTTLAQIEYIIDGDE